jgi:hypothetical protein
MDRAALKHARSMRLSIAYRWNSRWRNRSKEDSSESLGLCPWAQSPPDTLAPEGSRILKVWAASCGSISLATCLEGVAPSFRSIRGSWVSLAPRHNIFMDSPVLTWTFFDVEYRMASRRNSCLRRTSLADGRIQYCTVHTTVS